MPPSAAAPFTLAVIPDTQYATLHGHPTFGQQTQWLVDHAEELDLQFVLHAGDLVQNECEDPQWALASSAFTTLENAGVPYQITPGNHDIIRYAECDGTGMNDAAYNATFPLSRFQQMPSFGGSFDHTSNNTYSTFSVGDLQYLILSLQFGPYPEHLAWAREVAAAHPDHHTIVLTHDFIGPDGHLRGSAQSQSPAALPSQPRQQNGQQMWDQFVRHAPNVQLVLNGHVSRCAPLPDSCRYTTGVVGRSVATNDAGLPVHLILANYQNLTYEDAWSGDSGFLRLMHFDPAAGTVDVRTYSPRFDAYLNDPDNEFTLTGIVMRPGGPLGT